MAVPRRVLNSFSDQLSKRLTADVADSTSSMDDDSSAADSVAVSWHASNTSLCAVVSDPSTSDEWCLHYLFSFREPLSGGSVTTETMDAGTSLAAAADSNCLKSAGAISVFAPSKQTAPVEKLISAEWPNLEQAAEKLTSKSLGTWLAIRCDRNRLASHLLHSLPQIPQIVATDWKTQLKRLVSELGCEEQSMRPNEIWVAPDGRLIPLGPVLRRLSADRAHNSECETIRSRVNPTPALWPWESHKTKNATSHAEHSSHVGSPHAEASSSQPEASEPKDSTQIDNAVLNSWLDTSANLQTKSHPSSGRNGARKKRDRIRAMAVTAVAAVFVLGAVVWFVWPTGNDGIEVAKSTTKPTSKLSAGTNPDNRDSSSPIGTLSTLSTDADASGAATAEITTNDNNERIVEELTMIDTDEVLTETNSVTTQPSLDQLLGQLNMSRPVAPVSISPDSNAAISALSIDGDASASNPPSSVSVDASRPSITADQIVRGSLQSSVGWRDNTTLDSNSSADATTEGSSASMSLDDVADNSKSTLSSDINAEVSDPKGVEGASKNGPRQLNLKLAGAKNKETISIGTRVVTKNASLTASLQLPEPLVIEPNGAVAIPGSGFVSWKVALEDVEPELVVELHSKPGMRWQVTALVGVRLQRNAVPIPLGPNDAQLVGSRLLLYNQWLNQSIDSMREARSNRQTRGPRIDYTTQIRMLETEKRETEDAIKLWESIARLSHLVYSEQQIQVTLLPSSIATSPSPAEPASNVSEASSEPSKSSEPESEPVNENK